MRAGDIIASRRDEIARMITLESGLCLKDTLYEVGRASDVLLFSAQQALDFINDDELVEVTPSTFRLRKRLLRGEERAKARKATAAVG